MSNLEELFAEMLDLQRKIQATLGYPLKNADGNIILEADIIAGSMVDTPTEIRYKPRNPTSPVQCMHGSLCSDMGIDWVGSQCLCSRHLTELLQPIHERILAEEGLHGVLRQAGVLRPEYGRFWAECACTTPTCSATIVSKIGTACPWCIDVADRQAAEQEDLLLQPPDIEPDAADYEAAMRNWAERMTRGISAGITDEWSTSAAWKRAVDDVAA